MMKSSKRLRRRYNGLSFGLSWMFLTFAVVFSLSAQADATSKTPSLVIHDGHTPDNDLRLLILKATGFNARGDLDAAEATWREIREAYPNHPAGFAFAIDTLHWRKSVDYMSTAYDDEILSFGKRAIELSDAWLKRSPRNAEAHFYKGQTLVALMKLNGMQGSYYLAGTQGEKGRVALEEALRLDPELTDAKMPLGTYYYYASIATRYIRWLTWLWFVPTGEHDKGLAYIVDASNNGDLLLFEAKAQLSRMYLYNEATPEKAQPIVRELAAKYPGSCYLNFEEIEVLFMLGDYSGTIAAALPFEAGENRYFGDARRRQAAKIWRARAELLQGNATAADAILQSPGLDPSALHEWERRWLLLTQGNLYDLAGSRSAAVVQYKRVIALKTRWGSDRSVKAAKDGIDGPFRLAAQLSGPASEHSSERHSGQHSEEHSEEQAALPAVGLEPSEKR